MNILKNTTQLALLMCSQYEDKEKIAVDATCGNGHDTLWLAERFKKVYAFDIQEAAVESTRKLLEKHDMEAKVHLINDSHGNMDKYLEEAPQVIVFNLGYLPGGDKSVTTEKGETLEAVEKSLELLAVDGLLCITMYQGHEQGAAEREAILNWAPQLSKSKYHCVYTNMVNQKKNPPEILWITKKK